MNVKLTTNEYLLLRALHQGQPAPEAAPSFLTLLANKVDADLLAVAEWLTLIVPDKTSKGGINRCASRYTERLRRQTKVVIGER
jgi:hypothetical protein